MAVILPKPEGGLREQAHGDDVGIGQHSGGGLLDRIGAGSGGGEECSARRIEMAFSQGHDVQRGIDVGEFEHGRVVEEEILRVRGFVAVHPALCWGGVEDLEAQAARAGGGVGLEEDGLVGIAGDDRVCARVGEETLLQVGGQVGGDGQVAFDDGLGFDVGGAETVTMLLLRGRLDCQPKCLLLCSKGHFSRLCRVILIVPGQSCAVASCSSCRRS